MKFQVFQFQLSDEIIDQVNGGTPHPVFKSYLDCTMRPTEEGVIAARKHYREVAVIEAHDLHDVFTIGNIGEEDQIHRIAPMRSVSVGDVIVNMADRTAWIVDRYGFTELTEYTSNQVRVSYEWPQFVEEFVEAV